MAAGTRSCGNAKGGIGEKADAFIPLVAGGVTMVKLRGAMHDTCNCANLVAKKVRGIRD